MTIEEIGEHYLVHKFKVAGQYCLYEKEPSTTGRTVHKYLCLITKVGTKFKVQDNEPTGDIQLFIQQVNNYVNSLPYASEYYDPNFVKGYAEYLIIYDYLTSLNFKQSEGGGYDGSIDMDYGGLNIFGGKNTISLSIGGLAPFNYKDKIDVILRVSGDRWISANTTNRDVGKIKECIDGILKPLLLANAASAIELAEKLATVSVELTDNEILGTHISSVKIDLKEKLQKIIDTI